jgi:GxxExxY protein
MIDVGTYNKITYAIIGAAMEVHNELGFGFLEQGYQKGLGEEFVLRKIPFLAQKPVKVYCKNKEIAVYVPDFVVGSVVVEIKALDVVDYRQIEMQIINYLVATRKEVGLFINFGKNKLEYKRYILPEKFQTKFSEK